MGACYRFDCPGCAASIIVDAVVRLDIMLDGCPLCDATARERDFESVPDCDDIRSL